MWFKNTSTHQYICTIRGECWCDHNIKYIKVLIYFGLLVIKKVLDVTKATSWICINKFD